MFRSFEAILRSLNWRGCCHQRLRPGDVATFEKRPYRHGLNNFILLYQLPFVQLYCIFKAQVYGITDQRMADAYFIHPRYMLFQVF
jgi:hypothetical protein